MMKKIANNISVVVASVANKQIERIKIEGWRRVVKGWILHPGTFTIANLPLGTPLPPPVIQLTPTAYIEAVSAGMGPPADDANFQVKDGKLMAKVFVGDNETEWVEIVQNSSKYLAR